MQHVDHAQVVETALQYHDAGIRVVPVWPPSSSVSDAGKHPIGEGWQNRIWSRGELEQTIRSQTANIGVLCGKASGFVCIDIDVKHGGMRWFMENEHRLGTHLREETGGGGYHLYYRYPAGVERLDSFSGARGLAPGVEFKADGGLQVVTWPSVHKLGRLYTFHHGLTLLDLDTEADEPPEWLLEIVRERMARKHALAPVGSPAGVTDDPEEISRAATHLARIPSPTDGDRNNAVFRAAALGRDYGIAPKTWWPHVLRWYSGSGSPVDEVGIRKPFQNAYRYGKNPPGSKTTAAEFPDGPPAETPLSPEAAVAQAEDLADGGYPHKNPVLSAAQFLRGCAGLIYADETFYRYADDAWRVIDKDTLFALVWRDVTRHDAAVALKSAHVNEIIKAVQARRHRAHVAFDRWDDGRPGDFLRLQNGILDLNKIELLPHAPEWLSLTKLPFAYDEHAGCPRFEAFLDSLWGGGDTADQIEALQLWCGYLLSAKTNQQRFAMFLGHSRGGKGTLIRLMQRLVGDGNWAGMKIESFRGNFSLQELPGKKLISIGDAHTGTHEATSACAQFVLNVTGEDVIDIDRKNRSILYARLGAKIIMGANHMPKFFDSNSSITNRMILFRFVRSFQGREDPELEDTLAAEMPGILNWALRGLEKLNTAGRLVKPASASAALEEIAEALNPAEAFVRGFLEPSPDDTAYLDDVYELYKLWCAENGHKAYAKSRLCGVVSECFASDQAVKKGCTSWRAGRKRAFFGGLKLRCSAETFRSGAALTAFGPLPDTSSDQYDDDIPF